MSGSAEKGVVVLFDDDPQERLRIERLLAGDYEIICESNLDQCARDESSTFNVLKDLKPERIKAIVVDLIDNLNGPKRGWPGERIFRRMRERFPKGRGTPVVVLSVLVDDSGRVKEDQLTHLTEFADAIFPKSDDGYQGLRRFLESDR